MDADDTQNENQEEIRLEDLGDRPEDDPTGEQETPLLEDLDEDEDSDLDQQLPRPSFIDVDDVYDQPSTSQQGLDDKTGGTFDESFADKVSRKINAGRWKKIRNTFEKAFGSTIQKTDNPKLFENIELKEFDRDGTAKKIRYKNTDVYCLERGEYKPYKRSNVQKRLVKEFDAEIAKAKVKYDASATKQVENRAETSLTQETVDDVRTNVVNTLQRKNRDEIDELQSRPKKGDSGDLGNGIKLMGSFVNAVQSNGETVENIKRDGKREEEIMETLNTNMKAFKIQAESACDERGRSKLNLSWTYGWRMQRHRKKWMRRQTKTQIPRLKSSKSG